MLMRAVRGPSTAQHGTGEQQTGVVLGRIGTETVHRVDAWQCWTSTRVSAVVAGGRFRVMIDTCRPADNNHSRTATRASGCLCLAPCVSCWAQCLPGNPWAMCMIAQRTGTATVSHLVRSPELLQKRGSKHPLWLLLLLLLQSWCVAASSLVGLLSCLLLLLQQHLLHCILLLLGLQLLQHELLLCAQTAAVGCSPAAAAAAASCCMCCCSAHGSRMGSRLYPTPCASYWPVRPSRSLVRPSM